MSPDPVTMAFYALVCALLAAFCPRNLRVAGKLVIGAAVGLIAAAALPGLRAAVGF